MADVQMAEFTGKTPLECYKAFEKWYNEQNFVASQRGGNHYHECERIWEHQQGMDYSLMVLYFVTFDLNDGAM